MAQLPDFFFIELDTQYLLHPVAIDHGRQAETDIRDPVIILLEARNREDGSVIAQDCLGDADEAGGNSIVGCALALDDAVWGISSFQNKLLAASAIIRE